MSDVNKIAIIGATGFGGLQLIRLLKEHPNFEISFLGGERSAGSKWNDLCPFLPLNEDPIIQSPKPELISKVADFAVLSLPNGVASNLAPKLLEQNIRVLDLSADYRFRSLDQWREIYQPNSSKPRNDYRLCQEAIYGLPELNFEDISIAKLVSCPGCFPTASLLALIPFLRQGLIDLDGLIIDAKSGTSGGGRVPKEHLLFAECSDSISPYGVIGHRHTPEIEQISSQIAGHSIQLQFTPHLVPMVRGILSTVYARLRDPGLTAEDCKTLVNSFYRNHPFVEVLPVGTYPSTKWVKQTNKAMLSLQVDKRSGRLVLMCVIDNLLKGQAGQAVQNLNIMAGISQEIGLPIYPYYP
tara:strand:+ start:19792 stop:20856 length:1065 start_codon:yes stop_codon:yes gene_type:complete